MAWNESKPVPMPGVESPPVPGSVSEYKLKFDEMNERLNMLLRICDRLTTEANRLESAIAMLVRELEDAGPLAGFGLWALDEIRDGSDLDGGTLQEKAVELQVVEPFEATEACGENCRCATISDFPLTCYRDTEGTKRFRAKGDAEEVAS